MHILLTSAASSLAQRLAEQLAADHTLRLTERQMLVSEHEFVLSSLGHDASTNLLVRGMDAIVHVDAMPADTDTGAQIDQSTRCTYNLLLAAAAEGVRRVVYLSTLELMAAYDGYLYDTRWQPRPTTAPPTLTKSLGESTCKEFARESKVAVTVLRLANDATPASISAAIADALTSDGPAWHIVHVE
ncbi:MAG: NAD(P)-dependent oxidoreductase [Caldilineaceae bacterium]